MTRYECPVDLTVPFAPDVIARARELDLGEAQTLARGSLHGPTPYQSLTLSARQTKLHTSMKPAVVRIG